MNENFSNKLSALSFENKVGTGLILLAVIILAVALMSNANDQKNMMSEQKEPLAENTAAAGLTEKQKIILYQNGTENPYSSDLIKEKRAGTYYAVDTGKAVFRSEDKYDSGTGWPSFTKTITPEAVKEEIDTSGGVERMGILSTAGGHLGHVFTDGPADRGGLRYCINGAVLSFVPDAQ
jgi:peptide methionine sulfoxide reductase msrA/msrB